MKERSGDQTLQILCRNFILYFFKEFGVLDKTQHMLKNSYIVRFLTVKI